jgi:hypothetical protein
MKKTLLALAATLTFGYANAQMKVGSNPTVTTPTANLEVEATNGEKVIVEKATSKVGIGITSPSTRLHIAGALTTQIETVGTFNDILHTTGGGAWGFGDASRTMSWSYSLAGGPGGDGLHLFVPGNFRQSANYSDATISMYNDASGSANHRVGIATINPATTLDVNGTTKTTNLQVTTGAGAGKVLTSDATGLASWTTPLAGSNIYSADGTLAAARTVSMNANNLTFSNSATASSFRLGANGYLGIGTTNPAGRLHIVNETSDAGDDFVFDDYDATAGNAFGIFMRKSRGTIAAPANLQSGDMIGRLTFSPRYNGNFYYAVGSYITGFYKGDGTTPNSNLMFSTSNTDRMVIDETGKVGIGTTTPSTKLHATGALTTQIETVGTFNDILHTTGPSWGFGNTSRLLSWSYGLAGGPGGDGLHLFVPGNNNPAATASDALMNFYTDNTGVNKIGIGTINPATTLDVSGTTKTTNLQVTTGAGAGKVLTSDATGLASWQSASAATGSLAGAYNPIGTTNLIMAAGAAEADVPGVTQTFTLTKAATVNVIATGIISNFGLTADIQGSFKIDVDGTNMTSAFASSGNRPTLSAMATPITLSYNVTLAAGTHTIKLKYKPWNGGANINLDAFAAGYSGATAIDADALKSRMSILIFNN